MHRLLQRPSRILFGVVALLVVSVFLCHLHSLTVNSLNASLLPVKHSAVALIGIPDPAYNTAALYIRHISLANTAAPFQECPACFDYFPGCYSFNPPLFLGIDKGLITGVSR